MNIINKNTNTPNSQNTKRVKFLYIELLCIYATISFIFLFQLMIYFCFGGLKVSVQIQMVLIPSYYSEWPQMNLTISKILVQTRF